MPTTSQKIFIDSSAFLAFIDRIDLNHLKCTKVFETLGRQNYQLYTSLVVVLNTFSRIEKDISPVVANDFLQAILESSIQLLFPSKAELWGVLRTSRGESARRSNVSEMVNAEVMEKNNIRYILTFDHWNNLQNTSLTPLLR